MASFLGKINRMRNMRLHAANEYIYPNSSLYHEIVQGVSWIGGYTMVKPKKVQLPVDRLLAYVMARRPKYKSYAWCPPDNGGVYVHPAVWTSDRMQYHLDSNPYMNIHEAFSLADGEMREKQKELDLQVNLAREHAARLGVNNHGAEGLLKRANLIYGAVYEMKYEEASKTRRDDMVMICEELIAENRRLDMQDLVETMPIKEEQMQFFRDYPEYRALYPPLWYVAEEVVQAQIQDTAKRTGKLENQEGGSEFVEVDPNGKGVHEWPPQYIFDRENRNIAKKQMKDGVTVADAELIIAKQEALKYLTKEYQAAQPQSSSQYEPEEGEVIGKATLVLDEAATEELIDKAEALGEKIYKAEEEREDFLQAAIEKSSKEDFVGTLRQDHPDFYNAYREFLDQNRSTSTTTSASENGLPVSEYQKVLSDRDKAQASELQRVAAKYLDSADALDANAIASLRKDIREQLGQPVEDATFDIAEGAGAVNPRELAGFTPFDEFAPRTVDFFGNLELSPFYPENAFPPRGIIADPSLDLRNPSKLTKEQQEQLENLKDFGVKYAHAIEDHAPVKSKAYIEESIKWGTPIVTEHIPQVDTSLEAQAKEVLAVKKLIKQEGEPKTLEEYQKLAEAAEGTEGTEGTEGEESIQTPESVDPVEIRTEAALKHLKQQLLDELAAKAFTNEEERKDYERMLDKRYEYLLAKKKEVYEQWAQYWPSDKPEALIYRGPEVIREIFPDAYRLAVNRQYEKLTGLPLKEGLTIKTYSGLWKNVRSRENNTKNIRDLHETEWQHQIELDPSYYTISAKEEEEVTPSSTSTSTPPPPI